jgi:hypothetical protein
MQSFFQRHHRFIFYSSWIILALIQARFTELQDDEAYYWVYSKYLAWGYFDHPPMIALLVKLGYAISPNELGVRLFPLLLNVLSLLIIEKLLTNRNSLLFYAIACSIAVLQIAGFIAVPDIPLIFFTALFFLCYKRFTEKQSPQNILLLGLTIIFLFYTKYHAILIVLFTILSNLKLLKKPGLYVAALIALILYLPHLYWQWQHDWVSFRYHLFESNVDPYKFSYTIEFLAGQLLIAGPIAAFILLSAAFLYKTKTVTEKGLKWSMIGFYIFFLLSSFRGKVEPNWTSPALVSLIVLSHQYINEHLIWKKWLVRLLPITIVLVVFMRVVMVADVLPVQALKKRYHGWEEWPQEMKKKTKGLPIVFSNSYQRASKYWFYTGQMSYSQNYIRDHRNNYNFWPIEDQLLGKPVYYLDIYGLDRFTDSLKTPIGFVGYKYDSAFNSFAKVEIHCSKRNYKIGKADSLLILYSLKMYYQYGMYISDSRTLNPAIKIFIFDKKKIVKEINTDINIHNTPGEKFSVTIKPGLPRGKYYFRFGIEMPGYNATHNSEKINLVVE